MIPQWARSHSARTVGFLLLCLTLVVGPALGAAANPPTCCTDECADGFCPLEQHHGEKASKDEAPAATATAPAEDSGLPATCHEAEPSASPEPSPLQNEGQNEGQSGVQNEVQSDQRAGHGPRLRGPVKACTDSRNGVSGNNFVLQLEIAPALDLTVSDQANDARVPALQNEPYRTLGARGPPPSS